MTMYFFYQREEKSHWEVALASERASIANTIKPELTTALDVDNSFDEDMTAEEHNAVKYSGDMYFDFDASDIEEAIAQVKQFVVNLQVKGVNTEALKFFASGSKGFHVIMPWEMLMSKMPNQGIAMLPAIYREVAFGLFVDCMDLSVYSAKKGRQFRCPNIQRSNGRYKVQVTCSEILDMTPEQYDELCSQPRKLFRVEDPEFTPALGLIYSQARDKVDRQMKRSKASSSANVSLSLDTFGGEWPECLQGLLDGTKVRENVGWNKLVMQVALTGLTMGVDEAKLIEDANGLLTSYEGDGERYNSFEKRRRSLRDMFRYMGGNPCYNFSIGGLASVMEPGAELFELQGAISAANEMANIPDSVDPDATVEGGRKKNGAAARVKMTPAGVFFPAEEGWRCATELGFFNIVRLMDVTMAFGDDGAPKSGSSLLGYEVTVGTQGPGGPANKDHLSISNIASRQAFNNWTSRWGAGYRGTDMDTTYISDALREATADDKKVTYTIRSEGLDLILKPGSTDKAKAYEIVYSSPRGVKSLEGNNYMFRPTMTDKGMFGSDLMLSTEIGNTEHDRDLVRNLLEINAPENMSKLLGWFTAAFFCPVMRRFYMGKFPMLQVFGQAGAGKSETVALLCHLHYHLQSPRILSATGQTEFVIVSSLSASSSIPVVFEEVKPREMTKKLHDFLRNVFRSNYNASGFSRGGIDRDSPVRSLVCNDHQNRGPVAFVGEAIEDQTAVLERSIVVNLSKGSRAGRRDNFMAVQRRGTDLGGLGHRIANYVMALDLDAFQREFDAIHAEIWKLAENAQGETRDRQVYNIAVVMMGLRVLEDVLRRNFGEEFTPKLNELQQIIRDDLNSHMPSAISEASKVLGVMADLTLSRNDEFRLVYGLDYTVSHDGKFVDIKLKPAFEKYVRYCRSLGYTPLYDSPIAFITAMGTYECLVSKSCPDNVELAGTLYNPVYRFSAEKMNREDVGEFKG